MLNYDVVRSHGAACDYQILCRAWKNTYPDKEMLEKAQMKPTVCRALVYKWHRRFSEGRTSIEDDSGRGRKRKINGKLISAVSDVMEKDRRQTVAEVATQVGVSVGTIHTVLTEHLDMRRVSARWIPRLLSADDKSRRIQLSRSFLGRYEREGEEFLNRIITTDETWLYHYDPETKQQSSAWKHTSSPPPLKAKVRQSSRKNMFIFFMDAAGMLLIHAVPDGQTVNAAYYSKVRLFQL